jgi:large subunit ribosomal protein L15
MRPGFEGGQLPIIKRLPRKRGFTSLFRKEYSIVKLGALNIFEANSEVTPETL